MQTVAEAIASDIEVSAAEYLHARVAALLALPGNPYRAELMTQGPLQAALVQATPSPMLNQICGDCRAAPEALSALLEWFAAHQGVPAVPLVFKTGKPPTFEQIGAHRLRRLNGWTHVQLAARLDDLPIRQAPRAVEEMTAGTVDDFATIHANAFHTEPERQAINRAAFAGLIAGERAKGFLVRIGGKPAAGAIVYFASNGVAYLATAATSREARGQGCHTALIACRIAAARRHGSRFIAATATPASQSRRNLERTGLVASHYLALYGVEPAQASRPVARAAAQVTDFDWHSGAIDRATRITASYRSTQKVRRFFRAQCGEAFRFDRPFMAWLKAADGKTMGEAADEWLRRAAAKQR